MSSTNTGPAQTQTQNMQPVMGPPGTSYDPSNVSIAGGAIGGTSVAVVSASGFQTFKDDFRRATTVAGTIGGGWTLKGAYAGSYPLPAATGGEVGSFGFTNASGTVVYATRTLRAKPRQLQARWLLHDNGTGTDYTTIALIVSSSANLVDTMLHVITTPFAVNVQKRISGGAFIDLVPQIAISPQLAFDVPHVISVTVDGSTVRVQIDDVVDVSVTDADIPTVTGPVIVVEHFSNSTNVRYPMTIYEVVTR